MIYGIIAAVCFLLALGIMGMYYVKKKREEERKGFFVIAGTSCSFTCSPAQHYSL